MDLTGWTFDEVDAAPAVRCDWLLVMADAEARAAQKRQEADTTKQRQQSKGRRR